MKVLTVLLTEFASLAFLLLSFCFISHFLSLHLVCAAVELVVISYNEYNKSIANVQEETTLERMELLRSLPLFKNLSPNELKRFIQTCKTITFNKDDTIMRKKESGARRAPEKRLGLPCFGVP